MNLWQGIQSWKKTADLFTRVDTEWYVRWIDGGGSKVQDSTFNLPLFVFSKALLYKEKPRFPHLCLGTQNALWKSTGGAVRAWLFKGHRRTCSSLCAVGTVSFLQPAECLNVSSKNWFNGKTIRIICRLTAQRTFSYCGIYSSSFALAHIWHRRGSVVQPRCDSFFDQIKVSRVSRCTLASVLTNVTDDKIYPLTCTVFWQTGTFNGCMELWWFLASWSSRLVWGEVHGPNCPQRSHVWNFWWKFHTLLPIPHRRMLKMFQILSCNK